MAEQVAGQVVLARRADLDLGAKVLADAFHDDPWFGWLFPDEAQRPSMATAWFELVLERAFSMGHTYRAVDGIVNWAPPDVHFPQPADVDLAVALLGRLIGERASTAFGIIGSVGAVFPEVPRFHCVYVGVRPGEQGNGLGSALLGRVLDVCDAEGIPASLTSTNDANLAFYRRRGFVEIAEVPIADTGSMMRPMWREPR